MSSLVSSRRPKIYFLMFEVLHPPWVDFHVGYEVGFQFPIFSGEVQFSIQFFLPNGLCHHGSAVPSVPHQNYDQKSGQIRGFLFIPPVTLLSVRIIIIGKDSVIFDLFIGVTVLNIFVYWGTWSEVFILRRHHHQL